MGDKVKVGFLFKTKEYNNKNYFMLTDILIGYDDQFGIFYAKDNQYPIIDDYFFGAKTKFTEVALTFSLTNLPIKDDSKDLDDKIESILMRTAGHYFKMKQTENGIAPYAIKNEKEIKICNKLFFEEQKKIIEEKNTKEIYEELINTIIGQDEVVKYVFAQLLTNKRIVNSDLSKEEIRMMKDNIFINGSTGTGKTFMVCEIANKLDIPVVRVDATDYTAAGYVGNSVSDIAEQLINKCDKDIEKAQKGIVIIDEIDKLASTDNRERTTTKEVQNNLLTFLEGKELYIEKRGGEAIIFDTSCVTVVATGACSGIEEIANKRLKPSSIGFNSNITNHKEEKIIYETDDYIKYGFIPEFIGRFSSIYQTNDLTVDNIKKIITSSLKSPYLLTKKKFELLGYSFELSDEQIDAIAKEAYELKCGARGIKRIVSDLTKDLLFEALVDDNEVSKEENDEKEVKDKVKQKKKGH